MIRHILCLATVLGALAACTQPEDRIKFDGHAFKAKARMTDKNESLANFTVEISDVSKSLDGAREAGRYEGTRYCIRNYGTSRIKWAVGPDTDPGSLTVVKDALVFQGVCNPG